MILTGFAQSFSFAFIMRLLTGFGNGAAYVRQMALGSAWFVLRRRDLPLASSQPESGGTLIAGLIVPPLLKAYGSEGWRFSWYYLGEGSDHLMPRLRLYPQPTGEKDSLPLGSMRQRLLKNSPVEGKAKPIQWGLVYRVKEIWFLGFVYFMYGFSYIFI